MRRVRVGLLAAPHTQAYVDAVPDCVLDIRGSHETNGITTVKWTFRGTHTGDIPGFPAKGEPIHLDGVSVLVMDGELVKEERVYWDAATLFGLLEAGTSSQVKPSPRRYAGRLWLADDVRAHVAGRSARHGLACWSRQTGQRPASRF